MEIKEIVFWGGARGSTTVQVGGRLPLSESLEGPNGLGSGYNQWLSSRVSSPSKGSSSNANSILLSLPEQRMVLSKEVEELIQKGAVEQIYTQRGFYSPMFVVPKKGGGWRP